MVIGPEGDAVVHTVEHDAALDAMVMLMVRVPFGTTASEFTLVRKQAMSEVFKSSRRNLATLRKLCGSIRLES